MSGGTGPSQPPELDKADLLEIWKKTVDVQQHFNDIEWRIRGLALTVMTFSLGAAGVAARTGSELSNVSLAVLVLDVGGVLWLAFFVVDKVWYHPLLIGAVRHGEALETALGSESGLTQAISKASPYKVRRPIFWLSLARRREIAKHVQSEVDAGRPKPNRKARRTHAKTRPSELHSDDKLRVFYGLGGVAILLAATAFQVQTWVGDENQSPADKPQEVIVHVDVDGSSEGPGGEPAPTPAPTRAPSSPTPSPTPSSTTPS